MPLQQLELVFASAVSEALAEPAQANLSTLWQFLEPELVHLTPDQQLAIATFLSDHSDAVCFTDLV
ncbi:MAG: hypothetical protein WCD18_17970 [Thermosynechococcaceae cyanobacterium]